MKDIRVPSEYRGYLSIELIPENKEKILRWCNSAREFWIPARLEDLSEETRRRLINNIGVTVIDGNFHAVYKGIIGGHLLCITDKDNWDSSDIEKIIERLHEGED